MRQKNGLSAVPFRHLREKFIAGVARGSFDRHFLLRRNFANVGRFKFKSEIAISGEFLDEARICLAGAAAELMIQMADY